MIAVRVVAVALVVLVTTATASADDRIGAGYMMSRPIAGETGGADHALVARYEHWLDAVDVGVAVHVGHTPGNSDESLTRLAILPTVGFRTMSSDPSDLVVRADVAVGWQLADGKTQFGGIPVSGTEHRGFRSELGISASTNVASRVALRARLGLAIDGIYPRGLPSGTRLGPVIELAASFGF